MTKFDPEEFSSQKFHRYVEVELAKIARSLELIKNNHTMAVYQLNEQMKDDLLKIADHVQYLRNLIDPNQITKY